MSSSEPRDRDSQPVNPAEKIGPKNVSVPPPARPAASTVRAHSDDATFETDFADLAARFAAKSGGGLSAELSADLALEIVLNEIVEQACLATSATGAAIVLRRGADMICRATSGPLSPDLGSRLDVSGGLSGECVKTLRTVRCDDAQSDKRADIEASKRLGVRSVMVMPLLSGKDLVGAFELFSSRVAAFSDRDERTLEALATRTLKNLTRAVASTSVKVEAAPTAIDSVTKDNNPAASVIATPSISSSSMPTAKSSTTEQILSREAKTADSSEDANSAKMPEKKSPPAEAAEIRNLFLREPQDLPIEETPAEPLLALEGGGEPPDTPWWKRDFTTPALIGALLVCLLLFGMVVVKHLQIRARAARAHAAPTVAAAKVPPTTPRPEVAAPVADTSASNAGSQESAPAATATNGITVLPARSATSSVPPGGLRIYENGKEIFRATPPPIPSEVKNEEKNEEKSADKGRAVQQAAILPEQVVELSPEGAEESLLRRVEPQYPEQARAQKIQGAVVLDVHIASNGAVKDTRVISGDPLLAQASTDAVKQWRFKPHTQNGHPVQLQTRVTLNFRLPQ